MIRMTRLWQLALASHAIKYEFEYNIEKSDPERHRVYCSGRTEGCRWRINASKMGDDQTIKVRRNPYEHDCHSTRRNGKVKGATKFWVCEKAKNWLVDNPKVIAKELHRRLKDEYKVVVHYKRVYYAGRRKQSRYKGSAKGGTSTKRKHECPICHGFGHRWYTCNNGDPADIAAMLADRGAPKKKKKETPASTETSMVSVPRMLFPNLPPTSTTTSARKKRKKSKSTTATTSSGPSGESLRRSGSGSNQMELVPLSILPPPGDLEAEKMMSPPSGSREDNR